MSGYDGFIMSSKTMWASLGYDRVMADMAKTLAALQTEKLDIYYLHSPDMKEGLVDSLRAIHELHQAGSFVELGISNFTAWQVGPHVPPVARAARAPPSPPSSVLRIWCYHLRQRYHLRQQLPHDTRIDNMQ